MRGIVLAVVGSLAVTGATLAQVQWNEKKLPNGVFRESSTTWRNDTIDIRVEPLGELEYKLGLKQGDSVVYQWDAVDLKDPELLYSEFHGHTEPVNGAGDLMYYRKATGASERGVLTAPFTGIHGWYLKNDGEQPLVVRLKVAGFYELIPQ